MLKLTRQRLLERKKANARSSLVTMERWTSTIYDCILVDVHKVCNPSISLIASIPNSGTQLCICDDRQ